MSSIFMESTRAVQAAIVLSVMFANIDSLSNWNELDAPRVREASASPTPSLQNDHIFWPVDLRFPKVPLTNLDSSAVPGERASKTDLQNPQGPGSSDALVLSDWKS